MWCDNRPLPAGRCGPWIQKRVLAPVNCHRNQDRQCPYGANYSWKDAVSLSKCPGPRSWSVRVLRLGSTLIPASLSVTHASSHAQHVAQIPFAQLGRLLPGARICLLQVFLILQHGLHLYLLPQALSSSSSSSLHPGWRLTCCLFIVLQPDLICSHAMTLLMLMVALASATHS